MVRVHFFAGPDEHEDSGWAWARSMSQSGWIPQRVLADVVVESESPLVRTSKFLIIQNLVFFVNEFHNWLVGLLSQKIGRIVVTISRELLEHGSIIR